MKKHMRKINYKILLLGAFIGIFIGFFLYSKDFI